MLSRLSFRASRNRFADVAAGQVTAYAVDIEAQPDAAAELLRVAGAQRRGSAETRRLRAALERDARDALVDLLAARQAPLRLLAVRLCGALELEESVPWLELRLSDRNRSVREAAARSLGRIGGGRATDALLRALPRERVPWYRLTVEIARAAPSHHLESAVADPGWHEQRPAIMVGLALRSPAVSVVDFLAATPIAGPRDLIAACHVLARSAEAASWLAALLDHPDRRVRLAADRALRRLRNAGARPVYLLTGASAS
jgi:HEAT repeat protein